MGELKEILIKVMIGKDQRSTPKSNQFEGEKWMSRDTNKYQYKKKEDINRRNKKQKREQEKGTKSE